ncbi:MAG: hypothetical protein KBS52_03035 [Clostridiales bacterium]|nr:hypothetical protein [Candidatus Equinaster intestinalis]
MQNENLLKMVRDYQYKKSICYPKTHERIYCNLRIYYILAFAYLIIVSAILIMGLAFTKASDKSYLINTCIASALYTAAFVLMFFKRDLIGLILNIAATFFKALPLIPTQILNADVVDIKPAFYWEHLLPVVLLFIGSIWMSIISTRERRLVRRDKKIVLTNLYNEHHTEDMSEEDWENFVNNYISNYKEKY